MLKEHLGYLSDPARLERYRAAIAAVAQPGMRVVDLGCGTGVLGMMCLQAGASKVYAIDSTAMLEVARETFSRAGFGQQAEFIHGQSSRCSLPERVDLVVCDQVGYFGFDYGIVDQYRDARSRFLKPGGALVPRRLSLRLAAVESVRAYGPVADWTAEPVPPSFHWLRNRAANTKSECGFRPEDLVSEVAALGDIDLAADNPAFFSWSTQVQAVRQGLVHGLAGWFECELAPNVWMTNSPLAAGRIDRPQAFLPLEEPVRVQAGDRMLVKIMARPQDQVLAWSLEFPATGRRFSHSTWYTLPLSPQDLSVAAQQVKPRPNAAGRARSTVLSYCDGRRSSRDIERIILERHPDLLPSAPEITRFVADTIAHYCEP